MPDLNALLEGVRYVVVGGTATSLYMPARTTEDVDILVATGDGPAAERVLQDAGAVFLGRLSIGGTSWRLPDGTRLDVLTSQEPWVEEALAYPNRDSSGLPIIALPYLVLLKLEASRGVDIGDLTRMLGGAEDKALANVRAVIRRFLPDAEDDLESIIQLGRLEFENPPIPESPQQG
ncbi:MAG: nucleotidyltransferase family protein [Chloroflexi bacterium]|nr:nucleotidyltransferase family protein [Chloroflexota bacterium]